MKKIYSLLTIGALALGFGGCSETWDGNPVLETHDGTPVVDFLNIPLMSNQTILITEANQNGVFHLTCSQPEYGYAAVATYKVQVSLTEDFSKYEEIAQEFYDCAEINPVNGDVAAAVEKLAGVKTEADLPLPYQKVYVRLRSYVSQSEANTQYLSNVVSFAGVSCNYLAIWVSDVPVDIFIRGAVNDWGATFGTDTTPGPWQFVTGAEENTWMLNNVTIPANVSFKVATSTWNGLNLGGNAGENDGSQMMAPDGTTYALTGGDNPGHIRLTTDFKGRVQLKLEAGVYYITFDPAI